MSDTKNFTSAQEELDYFAETFLTYLERFPWISSDLLNRIYDPGTLKIMLMMTKDKIVSENRSDGKTYYALKSASPRMFASIERREMVRRFVVNKYGLNVLKDNAISPHKNSDFLFLGRNGIWVRVWGDMGNLAPESLEMFRDPPALGYGVQDIIVTAYKSRMEMLRTQAEFSWHSTIYPCLWIFCRNEPDGKPVIPVLSGNPKTFFTSPKDEIYPEMTSSKIRNGSDRYSVSIQEMRSIRLNRLSLELDDKDYELLRFFGDNPFFSAWEAAVVCGGDSSSETDFNRLHSERYRIQTYYSKITNLIDRGLLKEPADSRYQNRFIPTWKAIDLIAAYYGTIPAYTRRFVPWPQKSFLADDFIGNAGYLDPDFPFFDSHNIYSEQWGVTNYEHQKLCREFCLALVLGARSIHARYGIDIEASITNSVATNLRALNSENDEDNNIETIRPDASCDLFFRPSASEERQYWKIFIEIERNKNTKKVLADKIERYGHILSAAKRNYQNVALLFYFDESDKIHGSAKNKERFVTETMRLKRINGFVTRSNLTDLNTNRDMELSYYPKYGDTETRACGNLFFYRNIWSMAFGQGPDQRNSFLNFKLKTGS